MAAVAELYAVVLIAGAALLTRIGQRRPAVMLALITALYQCDLTLHTEACALLGTVGTVAAAAWVAVFVGKLYALAWAIRIRVSISAAAVATFGALGVAVLPHYLHGLPTRSASGLVALWMFALFAGGLHGARGVLSAIELDAWGHTVLRRALRAVWLLWSLLLVLHVLFWSMNYAVRLAALVSVVLLLATQWIRRESRVWMVVLGTLAVIAVQMPEHFAVTALMAATILALRAMRQPHASAPDAPDVAQSPYRVFELDQPHPTNIRQVLSTPTGLVAPGPAARRRLLTGALFGLYLSAWTLGWTGGAWPAHVLSLDVVMTAAVLLVVTRTRIRIALAPLLATFAHLAIQTHVVSAPGSVFEWGVASVGLGFVLLVASLAASYCLRSVAPRNSGATRRPHAAHAHGDGQGRIDLDGI